MLSFKQTFATKLSRVSPLEKEALEKKSFYFFLVSTCLSALCCSLLLMKFLFPTFFSSTTELEIALFIQIFCGFSFYKGALMQAKALHVNQDTLAALSIFISFLLGAHLMHVQKERPLYFEMSALLTTLFLTERLLRETFNASFAHKSHRLKALIPRKVKILKNGTFSLVPLENVKKGDLCPIAPGDVIAFDGVVKEGACVVDESMLGTSTKLVEKQLNSPLLAGSQNKHGTVVGLVEKIGENTRLGRILFALKEPLLGKTKAKELSFQLSLVFTPLALVTSLLAWDLNALFLHKPYNGLMNALSILIVTSPTALYFALSLTTKYLTQKAACLGVLVHDPKGLEKARSLQVLLVDESFLLGENSTPLLEVHAFDLDPHYFPIVKTLCEHLEYKSAGALLQFLESKNTSSLKQMLAFRTEPNRGVSGYFDNRNYFLGSLSFLKERHVPVEPLEGLLLEEESFCLAFGIEKLTLGYFTFSIKVLEGTLNTVRFLKKEGIKMILVTSEPPLHARKLAERLEFDSFYSDATSYDKISLIDKYKQAKKITGAFFDVAQDKEALSLVDVGFAFSKTQTLPLSEAPSFSIGLLELELEKSKVLYDLSQEFYKKNLRNFIFVLLYHLITLPLAFCGLLPPLIAGSLMMLCSSLLILNAANYSKIIKTIAK